MNIDYDKSPLSGFGGVVGKFIGSALFGCFVSLVIFIIMIWGFEFDSPDDGKWFHILWIIPVVWGVVGIFFFDQALKLARIIFESFFGVEE